MTIKDVVDKAKHALHLDNADEKAEAVVAEVKEDACKAEDKIEAEAGGMKDKVQSMLDKTDIDEKIVDAAKGARDKVGGLLDKTDVDEKIVDAAKGAKDKVEGMFHRA
jgi:hypothetical protein